MNTVLRTSVHTCIVTREAVEFFMEHGQSQHQLMPIPSPNRLVCLKEIEPAKVIEGGHIRAVFELTERVDANL